MGVAAIAAVVGLAGAAQGATYNWDGDTSINWGDANNWTPAPGGAFTASDRISNRWDAGMSYAPTYQNINGLTVSNIYYTTTNGNLTVTGLAVSVGAGGIDLPGTTGGDNVTNYFDVTMTQNQTWDVASGRVHDFRGVLSGSVNFTKALVGEVILSNTNNSYSGTTTISAGALSIYRLANAELNSSIGAPSAANGTISLADVLAYRGAEAAATDRKINLTASGTVRSDGGAVTLNGDGTDSITYSGGAAVTLTLGGGTGNITVPNRIHQSGAGSKVSFTKAGSTGMVTLNGMNTFSGQIYITPTSAGAGLGGLEFNSVSNVGAVASALGAPTTADDGTIRIGYASVNDPRLKYSGTDANGHSTDRKITTGSGFYFEASGAGPLYWGGSITITAQSRTVYLEGTGTGILAGGFDDGTGSYAVVKSGAGTWIYTNTAVIYEGSTTISDGTLLVNTSHTNAGAGKGYAVNGGTLGGTGLIVLNNGNVNVNSGASLAPGASAGTLTLALGTGTNDISGAVGGANVGKMKFELVAPGTSDQVAINSGYLQIGSGALNFDDFTFTGLSGFDPNVEQTFTLFSTPNAIQGTLGSSTTGTVTYGVTTRNAYIALADSNTDLTLTVIPEPATLGTVGLGALAMMLLRRARRTK
jgi:autotransporter-associated beta strand protein